MTKRQPRRRLARAEGADAANALAMNALRFASDAVIVDIGCGVGSALLAAQPRAPKGRLVGIEPALHRLDIARERLKSAEDGPFLELHASSAERLPLEDECADLVLLFDVFDYLKDRHRACHEIRRILRPNGRLIVTTGRPERGQSVDFVRTLETAGINVIYEQRIVAEKISFHLWGCARDNTREATFDEERSGVLPLTGRWLKRAWSRICGPVTESEQDTGSPGH